MPVKFPVTVKNVVGKENGNPLNPAAFEAMLLKVTNKSVLKKLSKKIQAAREKAEAASGGRDG